MDLKIEKNLEDVLGVAAAGEAKSRLRDHMQMPFIGLAGFHAASQDSRERRLRVVSNESLIEGFRQPGMFAVHEKIRQNSNTGRKMRIIPTVRESVLKVSKPQWR